VKRRILFAVTVMLLVGMISVSVKVQKAKASVQNFTLYGSISPLGWGFTSGDIKNPGPTITVTVGDVVNLTLISAEGVTHQFFVDYNGNGVRNPSEPESGTFGAAPLVFQFTASISGTFNYRCAIHTSMVGTFHVEPAVPEFPSFAIVPLFMLATLLVVFVYRKKHLPHNPSAQ